jgi:hypothetical protein
MTECGASPPLRHVGRLTNRGRRSIAERCWGPVVSAVLVRNVRLEAYPQGTALWRPEI